MGRDRSIDIARGLAIIAIALGHVLAGLESSGILGGGDPAYQLAIRGLYTFHLSVFAFTAGLFVRQGVGRDGTTPYLLRRDWLFLYLYVLWSLLQGMVKLAAGSAVNTETSLLGILNMLVPEGQLWFLPFLLLLTTAAALVQPWRTPMRAWVTMAAALLVSLSVWGHHGNVIGTRGIDLAVFFFAGVVLGGARYLRTMQAVKRWQAGAAFLSAAALFAVLLLFTHLTPATIEGESRTPLSTLLGFVASIAGVIAVLALSKALVGPSGRLLAFIGQRSLEIFLAHIIAASGTRIILSAAGVGSAPLHILAGLVAGVAAPLLLWWLCQRIRFPWLFTAPPLHRNVAAESREPVRLGS